MTIPSRPRASRRGSIVVRAFLLVALPLAAAACGDSSSPTDDDQPDAVNGLWTATFTDPSTSQSLTIYVRISDTTVEVMQGLESSCFDFDTLQVASRDGETFTLQQTGADPITYTVRITRDGDQIRVTGLTGGNSAVVMSASTANTSGLAECSLEGLWAGINGEDWVHIEGDLFTVYTPGSETCRSVLQFELEPRGGDRYFLQDLFFDGFIVADVENKGGTLVVTFAAGDFLTYELSEEDVSSLPICGGGDQDGIVCSELPALELGEVVEGAIEETDSFDEDFGTYFDLYGLTLDARTEVTIEQHSDAFDTLIRLWNADGLYIAENDDGFVQGFDSSLTITLDAACYRVEANSYPGDGPVTGTYTIGVD